MSDAAQTYDLAHLAPSLAKWRQSAALRAVYADIFAAMGAACVPGPTLEIGSGIGIAREFFPHWVTSDVVATPHAPRAVSAYAIPRENWANIVAFDVFHHLCEPMRFLESAAAALRPGGRIVLAEPAGTLGGRLFYRLVHPEPCVPAEVVAPYAFAPQPDGLFANMGMAHALFGLRPPAFQAEIDRLGLRIVTVRYRDLLAYPATGGFSRPSLLPAAALRILLGIESWCPQAFLRGLALRMLVAVEKADAGQS